MITVQVTAKPGGVPEAFPPPRPGDSGGGPPPDPPAPRSGHTGSWQGENHLDERSSRLDPFLSGACPRPETGVPRRRPLPALRVLRPPGARVPRARAGGAARPGEKRGAARRGRRGGASGVGRAAEDAGCEGEPRSPRGPAPGGPSPRGRRGSGGGRGGEGGAGSGAALRFLSPERPKLGAENFSPPSPRALGDPGSRTWCPARPRPRSGGAAPLPAAPRRVTKEGK